MTNRTVLTVKLSPGSNHILRRRQCRWIKLPWGIGQRLWQLGIATQTENQQPGVIRRKIITRLIYPDTGRDILLAVHFEGNRRCHHPGLGIKRPEFFPANGIVGTKFVGVITATGENKSTSGAKYATGWAIIFLSAPDFFSGNRIPGGNIANKLSGGIGVITVIGEIGPHINGQVISCWVWCEIGITLHGKVSALGSYIDIASIRVPGIGMPTMASLHSRHKVI